MEWGFPRLYEDGTITICKSIKGIKRKGRAGRAGRALGIRKKSFELTPRKRRLIKCSAIRQYLTRKNNCIFATLTFPGKVSQKYANECFSKFVNNLTNNYKLNSYVATKENHKSGNPHFHIILDIPWTDFRTINQVWNNTFNNRFNFSRNAFTTGRNPVISNIKQVVSYITKYINKAESKEIEPETRLYFISDNVLSKPGLIDDNTFIYLITKFQYQLKSEDHFSIYFIKNLTCLPEFYISKRPEKIDKRPKKPDKKSKIYDFCLSFE